MPLAWLRRPLCMLLLLVLPLLPGCTWRTLRSSPSTAMPAPEQLASARTVRILQHDGTVLLLRNPRLENGAIVGRALPPQGAGTDSLYTIPLASVQRVEQRGISNAGLVGVALLAAGTVVLLQLMPALFWGGE